VTVTIRTAAFSDDGSRRAVTFFVPDAGGYVRVTSALKPGVFGDQLSERGSFFGDMLYADATTLRVRVHRALRRRRYDIEKMGGGGRP
jgi:hypothetical protein